MSPAVPRQDGPPPFVGRVEELAELQAALDRACHGRGATILISGEPGIGKSRLADELAARAPERGMLVLRGCSTARGEAPVLGPWVQVLRAAAAGEIWPRIEPATRPWSTEIEQLVPGAVADSDAESHRRGLSADPEQARFRLFDSITRALQDLAGVTPLLVVLDDLHDADLASLRMLRFLTREIRNTPVLVIGIYREVAARLSASLSTTFGQLARECPCLTLAGLRAGEVATLVGETFGATLSETLAADVYRATEGNPFYVDEVARVWVARAMRHPAAAPSIHIPDSVRAAIRERLAPLTAAAHAVVTVAAALGREVDLLTLERLLPKDTDVLGATEEACRTGILHESTGAGRYAFVHTLIRDTVYDDLAPEERAQLHRRIGDELARRRAGAAPIRAAVLVHHDLLALPTGTAPRAIEHAIAAGDEALQQLAYEEAVQQFLVAQRLLDESDSPAPVRAELLLKLGDAQRWAGDLAGGRAACHRAALLARAMLGEGGGVGAEVAQLLARAALGYARVSETGRVDHELIALLEEALAALGEEDSALHSRVLARLAVALYFSPDRGRREAYSRAAVGVAERLGDPRAHVNALVAQHFTIWGPDSLDERLRVASQVVHHATAIGEHETELEARVWCIADLLEAAEVEKARTEHQVFVGLAEKLRFPLYLWYARMQQSMYAAVDGAFGEAERLAQAAADLGSRAALPNAQPFFVSQMLALRVLQGRAVEVAPQLSALAQHAPSMPIWRIGHVVARLRGDGRELARATLCELGADGFQGLPRDGTWLNCLTLLAHVCSRIDAPEAAVSIYDLLQPFAARNCVAAFAISSTGPVSLALGQLALVLGRVEEAAEHLHRAMAVLERMYSRPYLAIARFHLAQAMDTTDPQRAHDLRVAAWQTARELGMDELEHQLSSLAGGGFEAGQTPSAPVAAAVMVPGASPSPPALRPQFRREGDFWSIVVEGDPIRLKDSKGLRYLHRLLSQPGCEIHAIELSRLEDAVVAPVARPRDARSESLAGDLGDAGEILDAQAIAAYKRRLRDLREEIDEANENNDLGRRDALQEESDFLVQQLAAATGLGGRRRRAGAHSEQARVNVTKAIRAALDKIGREDEALGRRLSSSIRTGTFCAYEPDPTRPLDWEL